MHRSLFFYFSLRGSRLRCPKHSWISLACKVAGVITENWSILTGFPSVSIHPPRVPLASLDSLRMVAKDFLEVKSSGLDPFVTVLFSGRLLEAIHPVWSKKCLGMSEQLFQRVRVRLGNDCRDANRASFCLHHPSGVICEQQQRNVRHQQLQCPGSF